MKFTKLLQELAIAPEMKEALESRRDTIRGYSSLAEGLADPATALDSYKELVKCLGEEDDRGMLACQLWTAAQVRSRYLAKGIDDRIFLDTMKCFPRFLGETLRRTGVYRFDRAWWTYRQLSMVLFRLGQLEYETLPDRKVISVHIPSDALLSPELVDASLAQARDFFGTYFPEYAEYPMWCESWLLSPELGKLLPEHSRILAFQRRFRIGKVEEDAPDHFEWLFATSDTTPLSDLREDTSLQRSVKKHLLAGGKIGTAQGVMEL